MHFGCTTNEGLLYLWGSNMCKQLGDDHKCGAVVSTPTPMKYFVENKINVVQVSCSLGEKNGSTGCTDSEGRSYYWGSQYKGKLGNCTGNPIVSGKLYRSHSLEGNEKSQGWCHKDKENIGVPQCLE